MRAQVIGASLVAVVALGMAATSASAQEAQAIRQELDQLKRDFDALKAQHDARLAALEARLAAIRPEQAGQASGQQPTPTAEVPPGAAGAGGPIGSLPVYGAAAAGSKVFNPDLAVIGNFLGASGRNSVSPGPALQMQESEASFQAVVDPFARADFFAAFGEEGVELEEGFITFPTVPGGLLVKVGKIRAAFGKVNLLHNHVLPWTDRPLVTNSLVGGDEGISDAGMSVARLIPNPWIFLEATGQVFRGDSSSLFQSNERGDLGYVGHVRGYQDITDNSNINLGVSAARGHNDAGIVSGIDTGRLRTTLYGADATLRWRPLQRSIYRSFVGRSEVVWSQRDQFAGLERAMGWYVSGDYQFARRWFAGARVDQSEQATDRTLVDNGQSVMVTYWPSEFSQIRGQYRRTDYAIGPTANEFLFQFQFSIGAHGAHPF